MAFRKRLSLNYGAKKIGKKEAAFVAQLYAPLTTKADIPDGEISSKDAETLDDILDGK